MIIKILQSRLRVARLVAGMGQHMQGPPAAGTVGQRLLAQPGCLLVLAAFLQGERVQYADFTEVEVFGSGRMAWDWHLRF